ncbi:MAG: protein translocase subunit SecD [Candidatus Levybacteria bacterium]|nr:protein translocase subunit SecD [Candidatus Levybacteria bacterium]
MRRRFSVTLLFITLLAVLGIVINIPKQIHISFSVPGTSFKVDTTLPGLDVSQALSRLGIQKNIDFRKGLDLEGGTSITLRADMEELPANQREDALQSAQQVIERRINFFGVSEPIVQTSKTARDYRIIVEIPGVTDVHQAVNLIGTTAKLTFWEEGASGSAKINPKDVPLNAQVFLGDNPKKTNLSGSDLRQATVTFDQQTGAPVVQLSFTSEGSKKFADITGRNIGKRLGFALDNVMIDAPVVQSKILNGDAIISGSFTTEQAKQLQLQLNAGALPISLSVLEQHAIGATLGKDSLEKSMFAGAIGFIIIVVFMCVMYGRLGIIASIALVIYTLLTLSLFRLIPITLTLAGIAGFILSIGIAVDANILIFERMREELRHGKSRETALQLGFSRAWTSIRDSNIASLITSSVLYYFGTGAVRGFALTLAVGVLVSMFSAITVTRTILKTVYKN